MRHPLLGVDLPQALAGLAERIRSEGPSEVEDALGVSALAGWLDPSRLDLEPELNEAGIPPELLVFAELGGIFYALVIHAQDPGLVLVAVSYASADGECFWLGDDAAEGIANLPEDRGGAMRSAFPVVPDGWVYEECNDGVGVLAPADSFDPDFEGAEEGSVFVLEDELAAIEDLLARGFAGSALAVARNAFGFTALDAFSHWPVAERMQAAYRALGREFLAARIDRYLERRAGD